VSFGPAPIQTTRIYDDLGPLSEIKTTVGQSGTLPSPLAKTVYDYSQGRRSKATRGDNSYWDYAYNGRSEVIGGRKKWSDGTDVQGMQFGSLGGYYPQAGYTYDAIGNRTQSVINGRTSTNSTNQLNQVTGKTSYSNTTDVIGEADPAATVTVNAAGTSSKNAVLASSLGVIQIGRRNLVEWYEIVLDKDGSTILPRRLIEN